MSRAEEGRQTRRIANVAKIDVLIDVKKAIAIIFTAIAIGLIFGILAIIYNCKYLENSKNTTSEAKKSTITYYCSN